MVSIGWKILERLITGTLCWLSFLVVPLAKFLGPGPFNRLTPPRLANGLVIILPGIEGHSFLNLAIVSGLVRGGVASAIETFDWTWWAFPLSGANLRMTDRNRASAAVLVKRIEQYQDRYPDRPVTLIGHSGGGALTAWVLEGLPPDRTIAGCIQIAPALSPRYPLAEVLPRLDHQLVVFSSYLDWFFVGLGTLVVGTLEGERTASAGMVGYDLTNLSTANLAKVRPLPYRWNWLKQFNPGDHFGCVHVLFVAETIAPLVCEWEQAAVHSGDATVSR